MAKERYGSIEAGGTKFILAVLDENFKILAKEKIPTTFPDETVNRSIRFFEENNVDALGIGSFGPIDIDRRSATYGQILKTPKPNWSGTDLIGRIGDALRIPISFTTDVNASAYGEYVMGAGRNANSLVYFTVGTGIGGGAIQNDSFIGGISHAEMGHARVTPLPEDNYDGRCPFHGNRCYEGVASGPTIKDRTGILGENLSRDSEVFNYISYYVAEMAYNAFVTMAPEKIVFGGSVLSKRELPTIQRYFSEINNDYVSTPDLKKLIVLSEFEDNGSATIGNAALAKKVFKNSLIY